MQDSEQEATERSLELGARKSPGGNSDRGRPRTTLAFCSAAAGLALIYRALDQTRHQGTSGVQTSEICAISICHDDTSTVVKIRQAQLQNALL